MSQQPIKLLITGDPGCGKTTLVRRVVERLGSGVVACGFYTEEVRGEGRRQGFRGVTLDGRTFSLADRDSDSEIRVGPYGVELEGLESIGVPALDAGPGVGLVVLDEVGKMESFSAPFRKRVEELLSGPTPLLATVALRGVGFVKKIRSDPRVTLVRLRPRGRDGILGEVLRELARAGVGESAAGGASRTATTESS